MNFSAPFIARPVATTLLTIGIALAGLFAFFKLPVAPLPQVDFPTIAVTAQLPGASPQTVAATVAGPLEKHLGQIADVTEMTSTSTVGQTRIVLQFGLSRDINGAARDVQAAINAAHADLPAALRSNPTYRKMNPADAPILILALTSNTLTRGQVYDAASTILAQRLAQIDGVGQVLIGGAALPAVRVELDPHALFHYGIGLEDVRAALAAANANSPKGAIEDGGQHYQLYTNDQSSQASAYRDLVVAWRNGAAVRLSDVAQVNDSVENLRNAGFANGKPAVLLIVFRQPGANIISVIDSVKAALPQLMAAMPRDVNLVIANDSSTAIRSGLFDTEATLFAAVVLVTLVVFLFLRSFRATAIPAVVVPVSIIGTFAVMYMLGYSLDTLSLMALTISTGFVVDDAIVVLENISRHLEAGMGRLQAALLGAREVGFTVTTISLSLIAVFLPILLMGGIVGRLFREFAVTLSVAILVSLVVSLTTTPMMCALLLKTRQAEERRKRGRLFRFTLGFYERSLTWALHHGRLVMLVLLATVGLNVALYIVVPKGFIPQMDMGRLIGGLQADQNISFQAMSGKLAEMMAIVQRDPAVQEVVGFTGQGGGPGGQGNSGTVFVALKPLGERAGIDTVMSRLRRALSAVPGGRLFLVPIQAIRAGGRPSNAAWQYTLQSDSAKLLYEWAPKLEAAMARSPVLRDVNSDQEQHGLETDLTIDRAAASRLGVNMGQIDNTLYDAFGQRQVSTIYRAQNQYHVVMEVAPQYWQSPETLKEIYVSTAGGAASGTEKTNAVVGTVTGTSTSGAALASSRALSSARNAATNALANTGKGSASAGSAVSTSKETMVPLAALAKWQPGNTPLAVNHQGLFVASTISFNLAPGKSLSDATAAIAQASRDIGMPASIRGSFQGTARTFVESLSSEPYLILAALVAVYIVLGVLYESYVHPITILSTLPSAGVGAVLAMLLSGTEFSIISMIGVFLLIGIVKKNAIMMIDFALDAERSRGLSPRDAIFAACRLRFRPILMTTGAAMLGAVPLVVNFGELGELRRPLGIAIIGGLAVSQVLTLYTTPVLYLYLDRFRLGAHRGWRRLFPRFAIDRESGR